MKKLLIAFTILAGCSPAKQSITTSTTEKTSSPECTSLVVNGKLFASVYQQKAAEYKALCYQAFNFAAMRLDQALRSKSEKPWAIITDVDETILDNSMYELHRTLQGRDYESLSWSQWIERVEADTVPGAVHFLKYASSKNVEVFYVTNRDEKDRNGTFKNLDYFGFPSPDDRHLVMRQGSSSKEQRRQEIMSGYNVVLLLGDNLADFTSLFEKQTVEDRDVMVKKMAADFGDRFIIIPNPVYGDWEAAIYGNNNNYSLAQKDSIIKASGKTY